MVRCHLSSITKKVVIIQKSLLKIKLKLSALFKVHNDFCTINTCYILNERIPWTESVACVYTIFSGIPLKTFKPHVIFCAHL